MFEAFTGPMDLITKGLGLDKIKDALTPKSTTGEKTGNPMFDWLFGKKETADKAKDIKQTAEHERKDVFGDVWESVIARYYPNISRWRDLKNPLEIAKNIMKNPMNLIDELDSITADTLFVPDFMLKYVTDPIKESDIFKKVVEFYDKGFKGVLTPGIPLLSKIPVLGPEEQDWTDKIYGKGDEYDPDDVIKFIRIILKDKTVLMDVVKTVVGSGSAIAQAASHFVGGGGGESGGGGSSAKY